MANMNFKLEWSDEELQKFHESLSPGDKLMQATAHEVRARRNARDTRTVEQQWIDAVSKSESVLR